MSGKTAAAFANHADLTLTSHGLRIAFCDKVTLNSRGDVQLNWHIPIMMPLEFLPEFAKTVNDLNKRYQEASLRGPEVSSALPNQAGGN